MSNAAVAVEPISFLVVIPEGNLRLRSPHQKQSYLKQKSEKYQIMWRIFMT
jgi:hypothetical protein